MRGKKMKKGEQEGRQKEWKSPSGGGGEKSQSSGKNGSPRSGRKEKEGDATIWERRDRKQ